MVAITIGKREEYIEVFPQNLRDLCELLVRQYGIRFTHIFEGEVYGETQCLILFNDKIVVDRKAETLLSEGDHVKIIPPISGG